MSLRWRLTLISSLVLALLFALFSVFAYVSLQRFMYGSVDTTLRRQMDANLIWWSRGQLSTIVGIPGQFGSATFVFIDPRGQPFPPERAVPITDWLLARAMGGTDAWGYTNLADGQRARVLYSPVITEDQFGQRSVQGVLMGATSLELLDNLMSQLGLLLAASSIILLLIGSVGSYLLAGRALIVVRRVTSQARDIQTSQDLTRRIPEPRSDDEIGHLVRTFNAMLARLDEMFQAQRRFVADSSHELRTPLTVIRGNLHLLRRATDPRERAELISITDGEVSRLNRMVNDLLYIAQMQAGHDLHPVLRPVELDSLLLDVFALARSMASLQDQRVLLVHEDIATTPGDRDQLQHLFLNLIDNAVKYTPQGGTISIGLWTEQEWARIDVSDTGPGIAEADLPLLFERFFRTQDARSSEREGAGLGLAIVKSIAEAHNGVIEVYSQPGQGSTFRVWLPLASAPVRALEEEKVQVQLPAGLVNREA